MHKPPLFGKRSHRWIPTRHHKLSMQNHKPPHPFDAKFWSAAACRRFCVGNSNVKKTPRTKKWRLAAALQRQTTSKADTRLFLLLVLLSIGAGDSACIGAEWFGPVGRRGKAAGVAQRVGLVGRHAAVAQLRAARLQSKAVNRVVEPLSRGRAFLALLRRRLFHRFPSLKETASVVLGPAEFVEQFGFSLANWSRRCSRASSVCRRA